MTRKANLKDPSNRKFLWKRAFQTNTHDHSFESEPLGVRSCD